MISKSNTTPAMLCSGLPSQFASILEYVLNLSHDDEINYDLIESLFRRAALNNKILLDNKFDWIAQP